MYRSIGIGELSALIQDQKSGGVLWIDAEFE
jgi:hypothetical protein